MLVHLYAAMSPIACVCLFIAGAMFANVITQIQKYPYDPIPRKWQVPVVGVCLFVGITCAAVTSVTSSRYVAWSSSTREADQAKLAAEAREHLIEALRKVNALSP